MRGEDGEDREIHKKRRNQEDEQGREIDTIGNIEKSPKEREKRENKLQERKYKLKEEKHENRLDREERTR